MSRVETPVEHAVLRAWRADTLDDRHAWYYPLSARCLAAFDEAVEALRRQPRPTTEVAVADYDCEGCAEDLRPIHDALERGRGFAVIEGLPLERYSAHEAQAVYWMVGQFLGRPFEQNVQGTLLYDVRDTGQDLSQGARFSVTSYESSFHTDNAFGGEVLDYVGLLCLKTAKAGGVSQVVSGYAALEELRDRHPDALEVLRRPFHFDRRAGVRQGEAPTALVPVIQWDGGEPLFRYLRYWIEVGHQKAGRPLTAEQVGALDVLDGVLARPDLRAEFTLRPGQMFFINNRWILHNRTAFEDHPELERRRHYVRLWLRRRT